MSLDRSPQRGHTYSGKGVVSVSAHIGSRLVTQKAPLGPADVGRMALLYLAAMPPETISAMIPKNRPAPRQKATLGRVPAMSSHLLIAGPHSNPNATPNPAAIAAPHECLLALLPAEVLSSYHNSAPCASSGSGDSLDEAPQAAAGLVPLRSHLGDAARTPDNGGADGRAMAGC